ncbi:hypothetical protein [Mesorhizobium sp.]|uniref:hypothetical protein n=1 Tax=Mesorhizobium sp. TaxID=1871066 RepID=UPI000FE6F26D|nr:hypothetical protein [Mesorhizobium sp.]RWG44138.1 MAG: hypothetical protein EOQ62_21635 [Mesorhizobium sp.]RWJ33192.1 MAG: hypothetical protein EOR28_11445 [Mesorhizobium sp.]TIQ64436.1 MAG: hypothetical protein E5X41_17395 [Mesorhizobium sp.]TIQ68216.1 MAG: hypothetical protein E5X40_29825 [Mesorhizobium sp.]
MSGKAGIDRVLGEDAPTLPAAGGEQLALIPDAKPRAQPAAGASSGEASGRGRPQGARNRRTDEMVRYLNTFGSGPLVGLARVVNLIRWGDDGMPDFADLAKALGMKKKEAAMFWRDCARELAPYMHQKLPIAVDVTGDSAGSLVVVNLGAVQGDPDTDLGDLLGGHLGEVIDHDDSEENQ